MNDLIRINYESENPTVSGRELHAALEVVTQYKDWFPRMCEYGFREGRDFSSILRESADHIMGKKFALKERKDA